MDLGIFSAKKEGNPRPTFGYALNTTTGEILSNKTFTLGSTSSATQNQDCKFWINVTEGLCGFCAFESSSANDKLIYINQFNCTNRQFTPNIKTISLDMSGGQILGISAKVRPDGKINESFICGFSDGSSNDTVVCLLINQSATGEIGVPWNGTLGRVGGTLTVNMTASQNPYQNNHRFDWNGNSSHILIPAYNVSYNSGLPNATLLYVFDRNNLAMNQYTIEEQTKHNPQNIVCRIPSRNDCVFTINNFRPLGFGVASSLRTRLLCINGTNETGYPDDDLSVESPDEYMNFGCMQIGDYMQYYFTDIDSLRLNYGWYDTRLSGSNAWLVSNNSIAPKHPNTGSDDIVSAHNIPCPNDECSMITHLDLLDDIVSGIIANGTNLSSVYSAIIETSATISAIHGKSWYFGFAPNMTAEVSQPPADTCTYTSGDWNVLATDNCVISSPVTGDSGRKFRITGTGIFTANAKIDGFAHYDFADCINCKIEFNKGRG